MLLIIDKDSAFIGEVIKFILQAINCHFKIISPFSHDSLKQKGRYRPYKSYKKFKRK